jgi:hypothetical protein
MWLSMLANLTPVMPFPEQSFVPLSIIRVQLFFIAKFRVREQAPDEAIAIKRSHK